MKKDDCIAAVARLFGVAPSALRYWDRIGLVRFERDEQNNYRRPCVQTMLDISNVLLFRRLSIPLRDIRSLSDMDASRLDALLVENEQKLSAQIHELENAIEHIRAMRGAIARLDHLRTSAITLISDQLPAIRLFSFEDEASVQTYVYDVHESGIVIPQGGSPSYGIFCPSDLGPRSDTLRQRDGAPRNYLYGLLRVLSDDPSQNSAADFTSAAQAMGYPAGPLYGRFIVSAHEKGALYDYYEAWLEIGKRACD